MNDFSFVFDVGAIVALLIVPGVVSLVRVWARVNALEQTQAQQNNQLGQIEQRLESLDARFANVMIELSKINTKLDILLPRHTER